MTFVFEGDDVGDDFSVALLNAASGYAEHDAPDIVIRVVLQLTALCRRGLPTSPELLVSASEGLVTLGPAFMRDDSVCFECFSKAVARAAFDAVTPGSPGQFEAEAAASAINDYLQVWRGTRDFGILTDAIVSIAVPSMVESVHRLVRCSECNKPSRQAAQTETDLRIHCSRLTGIVRQMDVTTTPSAGAWRAAATWVCPLPASASRPLLRPQRSYGRGKTREEAEEGCIGEALERYSLVYRGDEPLVRARFSELSAIDPRSISAVQ